MQLKLLSLAFIAAAVANGAAILEVRAAVCPAGHSALCCQLDVDGVVDTSCKQTSSFRAACIVADIFVLHLGSSGKGSHQTSFDLSRVHV